MKVLHVIGSVAAVRGGASRAVIEMVEALQRQGIHTEIASTNDCGEATLDVPLGKLIEYQNTKIRFFPRWSPKVEFLREFALSTQFTTWLLDSITKYELLHVHGLFSYTSTVAMTIARLRGISYINSPHGTLCEWSLQQAHFKKSLYLKLIEKSNLNSSHAIHLTSCQEQQEILKLSLAAQKFILPLGLNLSTKIPNARQQLRKHLDIDSDETVILFLSRLHPKKGLELLIPALSKLNKYRFTFIIAGNGDIAYELQLKSLVDSIGISEKTRFLGFVEGDEKELLLQGSDLFVLTSYSENFGVAVLEALAAGLPVLVTPAVALASVVKEQKLGYVTELDVSAITSALENYLTNPQQAKGMGTRAHQFILENYTWEKIAANLIEIYQAILHQKPFS